MEATTLLAPLFSHPLDAVFVNFRCSDGLIPPLKVVASSGWLLYFSSTKYHYPLPESVSFEMIWVS